MGSHQMSSSEGVFSASTVTYLPLDYPSLVSLNVTFPSASGTLLEAENMP